MCWCAVFETRSIRIIRKNSFIRFVGSVMSSGNLNRFFRTIGFRISVWHSLLLILTGVVLLWIVHLFLSYRFAQNDRQAIQFQLRQLHGQYLAGGIPAIEKEIVAQKGEARFFIRV